MSPRAARIRRRCGYTLIELAVVLTIVGIAAAVVAPGLWRSEPTGTEAAVGALSRAYALAREAGVARGGGAEVHLRPREGRWVALAREHRGRGWDTLATGTLEGADVRLEAPDEGWRVVRFDARGRASGDVVVAVGADGRAVLAPDPWTGGLRVARR